LTIVLGRNVRLLYARAHELKKAYPGRVRLIGWTRRVPQLLNNHHLVVGKAGGATVHEAIAARCPMLIHHLVPGQEEGNLRLLETLGAGHLAESPGALGSTLVDLLADHAAGWRAMKNAPATTATPGPSPPPVSFSIKFKILKSHHDFSFRYRTRSSRLQFRTLTLTSFSK
jgi:processive 1,2-diacylglycerol beta-glucosyltransferase